MTSSEPIDVERELEQAHLFVMRGAYDEAHALLARLSRAGVPPQELAPLLEMIRMRQDRADRDGERRREWRYYLRLQTSAARIGWFVVAVIVAVHAVWNGAVAIGMGREQGFATVITTQLDGRYKTHPWTRPIYVDVLYSLILLVGAAVAMRVIVWVSQGAAQWEELDAPDPPSRYGR